MLSQFVREKHISLETYRKTGEAIRTPVWFIEENGELFVRTDSITGKIKRIRNNPRVRLAPCNARGTVKGTWVDGEARMIETEPAEHVVSPLKKKYGISYRIIKFVRRI